MQQTHPHPTFFRRLATALVIGLLAAGTAKAEQFGIQLDATIARDVPGPGAGYIEAHTAFDLYTFNATAGQIIFAEELSVAAAFQGWLQWKLTAPSGANVFSAYFNGTPRGRKVLAETGTYTVRVWVGANNPAYVGAYSFRLRSVPPDPVFAIQIGDTVTNGLPAAGAGNIEVPGASDIFTFSATAGQSAFFEELGAASAFRGWLHWNLRSPSSNSVFSSYLEGNHVGRVTFPETGTYRLRVLVEADDTNYVGAYSFRIRTIPADQQFPIQIGSTVSNGVPAAGAGNIEAAGAEDRYTFAGAAGQDVFFESVHSAPSLAGWLKWEVKTPGGQTLFSSFLGSGSVGRKTLPESGNYTIRCWVAANNPAYVGTYAFRLVPVGDSQIAIRIGERISDGAPVAGAGRIETPGGQDYYTFDGVAGQKVLFEQTAAAAAFAGYLRWEIKAPGGSNWFSGYFQIGSTQRRTLPETGRYTIRVFAASLDPAHVGTYAFRTYCEVFALPDKLAVPPGGTLAVPIGSLLCNDRSDPLDILDIELVSTNSAQGGRLSKTSSTVQYTPRTGFTGIDTFEYILRGSLGGESRTTVTVQVLPGADQIPTVVSLSRSGPHSVSLCLLGAAGQTYAVEESVDLIQWTPKGTLTANAVGAMTYGYVTTEGPRRFYRFRKP